MSEFIQICLEPWNAPFTVLLGFVFLYWTLFVLGTVGLDLLELDFDIDPDLDLDVDADLSIDAADVDVELDGDLDAEVAGGGYLLSALRFINLGEVPTMIVVSVLVFSMWAANLLTNYYLNEPFSMLKALGFLVPCFTAAVVATRVMTLPFRAIFRRANAGIAKPTRILGKRCVVVSRAVTPKYGQAELVQTSETAVPITINVRSKPEQRLINGAEALVIEHDEQLDTFLVVPFELKLWQAHAVCRSRRRMGARTHRKLSREMGASTHPTEGG